MGMLVSKNNLKHIPRVKCATYEMKIESTMVEMFREEINTVFCLFIANLWAVNKENILKFKKQQKEKRKNA